MFSISYGSRINDNSIWLWLSWHQTLRLLRFYVDLTVLEDAQIADESIVMRYVWEGVSGKASLRRNTYTKPPEGGRPPPTVGGCHGLEYRIE